MQNALHVLLLTCAAAAACGVTQGCLHTWLVPAGPSGCAPEVAGGQT
jgi:hypothetical protein